MNRIKDLPLAGSVAGDDYVVLDGATNNTRRLLASSLGGGGGGAVTSVAGRTGAVVLSTADISGLGTIASQAASSVAITGGTISGLSSLGVTGNITTGGTISGATSTNLVVSGGSSGASLTLFQGANAGATLDMTGTGALSVTTAGTGVKGSIYNSAISSTDTLSFGVGKSSSAGNATVFGWANNSGTPYGFVEVYGGGGSLALQRGGGNALIGGTTDIAGSGGLKVFGSSSATSTTSGAFQVVGGAGIGGSAFVGGNFSVIGNILTNSGSAAAPAIQLNGTANGLFYTGSNVVRVSAGGGEVASISSTAATFTGVVTGSNLSGTNTGDQTISLTGHVTGSGTGSFATTIANGVVTNAMLAGSIDLATKVTGTLSVGGGGTGAATLTANAVLLGNGASAVQFVAPGTSGNVLTSNGTTWTSAAPTGGGGGTALAALVSLVQPTGTINGTNTAFTMPSAPSGDIVVFLNGLQVRESGYSVSGSTLTLSTAPQTGDVLEVGTGTPWTDVQKKINVGTSLPGTVTNGEFFAVYTP
jgi:hypothetical protein